MPLKLKHNGKTYRWVGDKWGSQKIVAIGVGIQSNEIEIYTGWGQFGTYHTPDQLIKLGYMEIVPTEEEHKEEKTLHATDINVAPSEQSILMRLRKQIDCWIAEAESCADTPNQYNHYRITVLREVLYILDSLSPPDYLQSTIKVPTIDNTFTPQPGERIEVSNDGKKWEKKVFEGMNLIGTLYKTEFEGFGFQDTTFKYARPVENPIELLSIPEFNWSNDIMKGESNEFLISMLGIQLREITAFCQALRHRENNK